MREEDIVDPRIVPRWVPVGVSGVPRSKEWDAVAVIDVPELAGWSLEEIAFLGLADGTVAGLDDGVPEPVAERLASALEGLLESPYEARATRRGTREWSIGARSVNLSVVSLPLTLEAELLTLAVGPDGQSTLLVDGEEPHTMTAELEAAASELAERGRARAPAFVARAERIGPARWALAVDPL